MSPLAERLIEVSLLLVVLLGAYTGFKGGLGRGKDLVNNKKEDSE